MKLKTSTFDTELKMGWKIGGSPYFRDIING